jgi:basic membrane protein A
MKRNLFIILSIVLISVFALSAVSMAQGRVAIVFATGGLGDQSFNDAAFRGIENVKEELGIEYDAAEPGAVAEYENYLTQFSAMRRYDLIISIGFDQADALTTVAERYPNQKYAIIDMVVDKPNVASYVYEEKERGFLMGAAAAMMTSRTDDEKINPEKVVGVIGGMKIPLIDANIAGFKAGAEYIDPEVEALHSYVGAWADPSKGKELAISMIENDADVIWGAAGRSGLGILLAAEENNIYGIGADSDQGHVAPGHVLTNGMKFVDKTVEIAVRETMNDQFDPGVHVLGVEDGGLGYTESLLPEDVIEKLDEIEKEIAAGNIEIPGEL